MLYDIRGVYNKFVQAHMLHCLFSFSGKVVMLHVFYILHVSVMMA